MEQELFQKQNRQAAAEGIILLKNEGEMLPLQPGESVAVYGRPQLEYYRSGTGSGGAVNVPYTTNILEGLKEHKVQTDEELEMIYREWIGEHPFDNGGGGWAAEPWYQKDMPLEEALVQRVAARTKKAVYIIGRTAGEDKDNLKSEGSYYLTEQERKNLELILAVHKRVAVLFNVSNILDMSWLEEIPGRERIKAVMYLWQGGMDGGSGVGDILSGACSPSGKLPDTIARNICDYPADANFGNRLQNVYAEDIYVGYRYFETFAKGDVLFPFGFGLSYTDFEITYTGMERDAKESRFQVRVTNTGKCYAGKEVVQLYYEAPQGSLGKPVRQLGAFAKTGELGPGESEELVLILPHARMASYDDSGCSGYRSAYVLEAGTYAFYLGANVRDARLLDEAELNIEQTVVTEQLEEAAAPRRQFDVLKPGTVNAEGIYGKTWTPVAVQTEDVGARIKERLPESMEITGDRGITLQQVREDEGKLDAFIAQLSCEELAMIVRGEGMSHPKVTKGTASAFGGVSDSLRNLGIPLACCADGPSGLRMEEESVQIPIGTMLASTWNPELVRAVYKGEGALMRKHQVDTLLGPGINIHRHPLNGRNFEYYSEDPYLTGVFAAAAVKGLEDGGASGTLKHYACNGQETFRHRIEAVCSERALREIYLKGFEMAVKSGAVVSVMTAYNPLNGYWTASHYDLNTTILRKEWGYTGMVMTDWWAKMNDVAAGGEESDKRIADMVRAQNDVYMVVNNNGAEINSNGDDTLQALEEGRLTVGELQRCAKNICRFILKLPVIEREIPKEEEAEYFPPKAGTNPAAETQETKSQEGYCLKVGEQSKITFAVEEAGTYTIVAEVSSKLSNLAQSTSNVTLNGKNMAVLQTKGTEGKWITQKLQKVSLGAGTYEMEITRVQAGLEIRTIEFRK